MKFIVFLLCLYLLVQVPAVRVYVDGGMERVYAFFGRLLETPDAQNRRAIIEQRSAPARSAPIPTAKSSSSASDELKRNRAFGSGSNRGGSY
ncbi:MAG TPA: hypothetical protein VI749_08185 [Candidatus Omnitrophota bacterium]|nr:hypothetical protein [Candidatus Omnitrophota bacterium]